MQNEVHGVARGLGAPYDHVNGPSRLLSALESYPSSATRAWARFQRRRNHRGRNAGNVCVQWRFACSDDGDAERSRGLRDRLSLTEGLIDRADAVTSIAVVRYSRGI